jgi:hypothetical protein
MVKVVMRALAAVTAVLALSATAIGCGSGVSQDEAETRCKQDQTALGFFFDDKVMAQCVACQQDCGNDCTRHSTSPITYSCSSGDTSTGTGGAGGKQ